MYTGSIPVGAFSAQTKWGMSDYRGVSLESSLHQTLGCDCPSPVPKSPTSALCATCGLIYMTSEQYGEFLARCRAEIAALLADTATAEATEPEAERESRRWFKRRRGDVAASTA